MKKKAEKGKGMAPKAINEIYCSSDKTLRIGFDLRQWILHVNNNKFYYRNLYDLVRDYTIMTTRDYPFMKPDKYLKMVEKLSKKIAKQMAEVNDGYQKLAKQIKVRNDKNK